MEVEEAIRKRKSVRAYRKEKIPREKIEKILDSVRMAPSAKNKQDWKFVIIDDEDEKEQIYKAANKQRFVKEAPVVIAGIATEPEFMMSCDIPGGIVDVSIALDHLTLKAAEEGLGTCWIGAYDQEEAKKILEIPEDHKIVCLMTLGYPKKSLDKTEKRRKNLKEIIYYNSFSD